MLDILGPRGLKTNPHFEKLVTEKYAWRDLEEEAVKMVGWLDEERQVKAKRKPTTPFVLKWLGRPVREAEPAQRGQPRGQPDKVPRLGSQVVKDPRDYTRTAYPHLIERF